MTTLTFLGTGGGRFATIYQVRSTGGLYLRDGARVHIDPGPGALVNMAKLKLDPARTDALLISHCHPDHYSDAEVLLEGMTRGGLKKRGHLIGSTSVIEGDGSHGPAVSHYHRNLPERTLIMSPGQKVEVEGLTIEATRTKHSDPSGIGFLFHTQNGKVSYMSDTELDDAVMEQHRGCRLLVLALTRPLGARVPNHICTDDAAEIAKRLKPEMVVLSHFGAKLIFEGAERQAQFIERYSRVKTVAAEDLMTIGLGKTIKVVRKGEPSSLDAVPGGDPDALLD